MQPWLKFFACLTCLLVNVKNASNSSVVQIYYVKPTSVSTCPEVDVPCLTLNQYANKTKDYFALNATFILLPGNHSLDFDLRLRGNMLRQILKLETRTDYSRSTYQVVADTIITCHHSSRFKIERVQSLQICGISFVGCVDNSLTGISWFTLEDSSFQGQGRNGTGLILDGVWYANIRRTSFSSNTGAITQYYIPYTPVRSLRGGGAILIISGLARSNVNIVNCTFTNNTVDGGYLSRGGAILAQKRSVLTITNSTFANNLVNGTLGSGGAVHAQDCTVNISDSTFTTNTVTGNTGIGGLRGGALAVEGSTIAVTKSVFTSNSLMGQKGKGGGLFAIRSSLVLTACMFTSNTVTHQDLEHHYALLSSGGGVYAIFHSNVTVIANTFSNNYVAGQHGTGGTVHIDYDSNVTVCDSTFINNTVSGIYGSGGALWFRGNTVMLSNTTFIHNIVTSDYGQGGALFVSSTTVSSASVTLVSVCFLQNIAASGVLFADHITVHFSGETIVSNNYGSLFAFYSNITFTGCINSTRNSVLENSSPLIEGGAVTGFQSSILFGGTVNFQYNTAQHGGAILLRESKMYTPGVVRFTLADNMASSSGGGIYAYQSEVNLQGVISINWNSANETGGGVVAIGSTILISHGSIYTVNIIRFVGNNAKTGGAISLMLNSKVYILKHITEQKFVCEDNGVKFYLNCIRLEFIDNSADYGGAVYISDNTNSGTCEARSSSISSLSECFLQALGLYSQNRFDFDGRNYINTYFVNNSATVAGGSLFGGLLDRCTLSPYTELLYKSVQVGNVAAPTSLSAAMYLLNVTNLQPQDFHSSAIISSESVRLCFCRGNQPDCSYNPSPVCVKKGQSFTVTLVTVDQVDNTIPYGKIHGSVSLQAALGEGQSIQEINGSCSELKYNVFSPHHSEQLLLYAEGPCMGTGISKASLTVHITPCPVGFTDTGNNLRCDCDPRIVDYVYNCSIGTETVLRKDNVWFSFENNTKHQRFVFYKHCPFDYCRPPSNNISVNMNVPNGANVLCSFNRSGKLCGSCEDGLSLSLGSSRCMSCSNSWIALTAVLIAVAGIALVALLLICNLTVVAGTINGLTLYANVIAANRAILFPIEKTNLLTVFIAWINLDFGFQTCFFDGMDGFSKVWLQLVFPIYILLLVAIVIVVANRYYRFARLLFNLKNPVATLATLILLSYTKFIRIIIVALTFGTLEYSDGFRETVWLYDANVPYVKGKHISLFITALVILVLGTIYTLLLLCWQCLNHCPPRRPFTWITAKHYVIAFMHAYHAPFNNKHRYWTGLLLLTRVILYLIAALNVSNDPTINLVSIMCIVVGLLVLNNPTGNVYRKWPLNLLESSYFINLSILALFSLYVRESNGKQTILAYTSVSIAFVTFVATLVYHSYEFVFKRVFKRLKEKLHYSKVRGLEDSPILDVTNMDLGPDLVEPCSVTEIDGFPIAVDTDGSPVEDIESDTLSIEDAQETNCEEVDTSRPSSVSDSETVEQTNPSLSLSGSGPTKSSSCSARNTSEIELQSYATPDLNNNSRTLSNVGYKKWPWKDESLVPLLQD